ncbi:unnamed protein product [Phaeothamnion confervicola]
MLNKLPRLACRSLQRKYFSSTVGFIGAGNMGSNMASNLVKVGHEVCVFDANPEAAARVEGALLATSVAEVAERCGVIFTMLPNTSHCEAVYAGPGGLFESAARGRATLLVDSSTIDIEASRALNRAAAAAATSAAAAAGTGTAAAAGSTNAAATGAAIARNGGVPSMSMIDAPVSGGVPAAASGSLTFMVGGRGADLERARPYLETMGKNVVHCGGAGAGLVAKLCNNLSLAISMIATAEAMNLGVRLGMDPKLLAHVLNISTARCWSSDTYNPFPGVMDGVPAARGYSGGFPATLMQKDLSLALAAGRAAAAALPMGAAAHQLYGLMAAHGGAKKDFSGIYELIAGEKLPGAAAGVAAASQYGMEKDGRKK